MELKIAPQKLFKAFACCIIVLALCHLSVLNKSVIEFLGPRSFFINLFNLDSEDSLATVFCTFEWIICVLLLYLIGCLEKKREAAYRAWYGLSLIFIFLAVDELTSIHEWLSVKLQMQYKMNGVWLFEWIIPYSLAILFFGIIYLKFILLLPQIIKKLFITSAIVFLSSAIGVEMLEGRHTQIFGRDYFYNSFYVTIEESGEMLGLLIFIYALMSYIKTTFPELQIIFVDKKSEKLP